MRVARALVWLGLALLALLPAASGTSAQTLSTADADSALHTRACPTLKSATGTSGSQLTCTPSAGARQNLDRVLADPGQLAFVPRDLALAEIQRRGNGALRELRVESHFACVFAVVGDADLFTSSDVVSAAQSRELNVPGAQSGVGDTLALLRQLDPRGLGRSGEPRAAANRDAAIKAAISEKGIAILVEPAEDADRLARQIAAQGGRLVPLQVRRALGHRVLDEVVFVQRDVRLGTDGEPALCTPYVVVTGETGRIADQAARERHARVASVMIAMPQPGRQALQTPVAVSVSAESTARREAAPPATRGMRTQPPPAPPARPRIEADAPPATAPPATPDDKPFTAIPVYFGTDRNRTSTPAGTLTFGTDGADRLSLGQAIVTIPRNHRVDRGVERPSWLDVLSLRNPFREDPALHFTLDRLDVFSNEEQFLGAVRARMSEAREFKNQALVFVHGYRNTFDDGLFRAAQIAYDTGFDGATFLYSWPSAGGIRFYVLDENNARDAVPHLEAFLDLVVQRSGAETVHVIAHSMGNLPLLSALKSMASRSGPRTSFKTLVMAAPDVSWRQMQETATAVAGVSRASTLYASQNDRALQVSRELRRGQPRAGDVTKDGPIVVEGVDSIDVSATGTELFALNHSGFAEAKELVEDLKLILRSGKRMPDRNDRLLRAGAQPRLWWRVPAPASP